MALNTASPFDRRPGIHNVQVPTLAHAAATATELIASHTFTQACRLRGAHWVPFAAVTGVDTHTTHLNLQNRGAAGTGTTELANLDFTDALDAAIAVPLTMSSSLTTAIVAGATIALQAEKVGNGLLIPAGMLILEYDYQTS